MPYSTRLAVLPATLLLCFAKPGFTADIEQQLPEITISGTAEDGYYVLDATTATKMETPIRDVPQSIEVRTRQILDDQGGQQTSYEVGKTVAGVFGENGQGDPGRNVPLFFFRGYTNSGAYLKDGHMVNGWMSTMDMANIERVEFLKGPASDLYGGTTYTGNIGGLVNYVSKLPQAGRVAAADLTAGSYGFYRATADYGQSANEDKTALFRINGALEQGNSFMDFAEHDNQFIAPAATFLLSPRDTLTILVDAVRSHEIPAAGQPLTDESFGIPRSRNFIDPGFAKTDIHAENFAAKFDHAFNANWHLDLDLTGSWSDTKQYDNTLYYVSGGGSTLDASNWNFTEDQTSIDLRLNGKFDTGQFNHNLLLGFNVNRNRYFTSSHFGWNSPYVDLSGSSLDQIVMPSPGTMSALFAATPADPGTYQWNADTQALYLQDLISFTSNFKLLLSARQDWFKESSTFGGSFGASSDSITNSHTSPRVGLVYQPTQTTSIYVVQAESFTPNEGITLNNEPPPPETGLLREIGIKQSFDGRLEINLAYYELKQQNMVFSDPADPNGIAVIVAGETQSQGFEIDLNGQITDALRLNVAATIMKARVSEGDPGGTLVAGQEFAGVPGKTLNIFGVYSFGEDRAWDVGGGIYYASEAWADSGNTFHVPSMFQIDAMAAYRFDAKTSLQINLKNLTNRNNYTSNGWGWINPGEPTSVFATLRHAF